MQWMFMDRVSPLLKLLASCLTIVTLVGCEPNENSAAAPKSDSSTSSTSGAAPDKVTLMLNWYPEAEHGGFFAAQVHGIFAKHGLEVTIRAGGENAPVAQELITGRAQFAVGNADDVLLFREQAADIVALLAPIQQTPRCILVRTESGIDSLSKLKGLTLQANKGQAFLSYMEKRNMLEGVQVVPYAGSVAQFVSDKNTAIQAYNFSEPLLAEQQGVKVTTLMLGEIGFNPYASCLLATGELTKSRADLAKRMTAACREGWQKYLESPQETNDAILKLNPERMTKEALAYGAEKLKPLCVTADSAPGTGKMTAARWQELVQQFIDLKLVTPEKVKAEQAFVEL